MKKKMLFWTVGRKEVLEKWNKVYVNWVAANVIVVVIMVDPRLYIIVDSMKAIRLIVGKYLLSFFGHFVLISIWFCMT